MLFLYTNKPSYINFNYVSKYANVGKELDRFGTAIQIAVYSESTFKLMKT